jgi:hypothetical protein
MGCYPVRGQAQANAGRFEYHPQPVSLVPEKLTVLELYHILVLTEKYDVTEITHPWARQWVNCIRNYVRRDGGHAGHEMHS